MKIKIQEINMKKNESEKEEELRKDDRKYVPGKERKEEK